MLKQYLLLHSVCAVLIIFLKSTGHQITFVKLLFAAVYLCTLQRGHLLMLQHVCYFFLNVCFKRAMVEVS